MEPDTFFQFIAGKHYPIRFPPKKWPSPELIGKAMVRGWAVPARYYEFIRTRGLTSYVGPGIPDIVFQRMMEVMEDA